MTELINCFINVNNSGDSVEYIKWFKNLGFKNAEIANAVTSNLNAYGYIGKVKIRKIDIISSTHVEGWAQTFAYDS